MNPAAIIRKTITCFFWASCSLPLVAEDEVDRFPDIASIPFDLEVPAMELGSPKAGRRVKRVLEEYQGTQVFHTLYLPDEWRPSLQKRLPVIVEYAGNGPYKNAFGDTCTGKVEDCKLGFGIGGGRDFIWVCLPYVSKDRTRNQRQWWGDIEATVDYCKKCIPRVCKRFQGDLSNVFLVGFSRGAIACNYIGLHDEEISKLWRGFVCHSHYDGVRSWSYPGSDRKAALERLSRLNNRPQFISHERSVQETRDYLIGAFNKGTSGNVVNPSNLKFVALPYRNHTDTWVLRDTDERKVLRNWFHEQLAKSNR